MARASADVIAAEWIAGCSTGGDRSSAAPPVMRLLACLVCAATLSGCASISQEECLQGDWQLRGYRDGRVGKPIETIAEYSEDCGKHGVEPDAIAYSDGLATGLREYCTGITGLDEGKRNAEYAGACPVEREAAFLDGYIRGLQLAREELLLNAESMQQDLDEKRDQRLRLEIGESSESLDDSIDYLSNRLASNARDRQSINSRIERWTRRLQ